MKLYFALAMLMFGVATSAFAEGRARTAVAAHMRAQLFHDRTPHVHQRAIQQRQR